MRHPIRCRVLAVFSVALLLAAAPARAQESKDPWDGANRDKWQQPEQVMDELGLKAGSWVADVGCGSGYFTYHLADRVMPQGRVYAVDIREKLINEMSHQALGKWLIQVKPVLGAPDNPHLPRGRFDAILLVHSYHEMPEHDAMTEAFYRALRPGGRLGIIEFAAPDSQQRDESYKRHKIPASTVKEEILRHGFEFVATEPGFIVPGEDGAKQYFLLFAKPGD